MPLFIKDDAIAELVAELAMRRNTTKQDAVRQAVQADLSRLIQAVPLKQRLTDWRAVHKLPPATGLVAGKEFFDELSGDL